MAAARFASTDQLNTLLDTSFSEARAGLVLDAVSDDIRSGLGWSVTQEIGVSQTLDGLGKDTLSLATLWLTAVASVVEDGVALVADVDYTWSQNGVLTRIGSASVWVLKPRAVVVVCTHGYPDGQVPGIFRTVCLDWSAFTLVNPSRLRSVQVGAVAQTADPVAVFGANDAGGDPRLDRYRIPR